MPLVTCVVSVYTQASRREYVNQVNTTPYHRKYNGHHNRCAIREAPDEKAG